MNSDMSKDAKFIHLRAHSDFSMVDGLSKVKPLVKAASERNMPALALTDQMNFCGLVQFYGAAHGAGLKPIIGADLWLQTDEFPTEQCRLVALAHDNQGYKNLTLLISKAYQRGAISGRAVVDREWLAQFNQGLILLSGAKDGDLGKAILKQNREQVASIVNFYQTNFADRYFIELIRSGREQEEEYLHSALKIAQHFNLPVVATNEVVFIESQQFEAHEVRVCIHDGYTLDDKRRPKRYSEQQYLRTQDEMCELFADIPEALANSVEIAKRCNVTIRLGEYFLPKFPTGELSTEDFLIKVSREGLEERLVSLFPDPQIRSEKRNEYEQRLEIELEVINQMGFPGYFLIVMEFIQWSKDNGIPVGPGRGSGAGSLVAYALKITDLDPLAFDLLFERFLNPERVSMPDFDIDFCMDRRDEVIDHVAEIYGRDAVSQIITFGTMAAKAVVRDVGRVMGHPYGFVDRIAKLIPPDPGMTLTKAFEVEPQLPEIYQQDEEVKELIDMARILEGSVRNAGKHAGGVVISPTKITDFAALYCDEEGNNPVTQFDKNDVEYAGLVKFDFLGLRTLTIIQWALDMLNEHRARKGDKPIFIESIPINDQNCFKLLKQAKTTAVFQLESRGMKDLIKRLQPDCFEDIIALVALFRPGPLQSGMVDNFIDRKHGREQVSYPDSEYQHEALKPILEPTYGIILYQEQVMQIAQVLSGYSLGGADLLRRAMGKKKPEEMEKQRGTFKEGAIANGIDGELSMKIFDLVEKFAGYGFNKSHSAAYALVSYQTLWMKTHFPAYFMAAVMSADMDNTDKIVTLVDECENMKLTLTPPNVNDGQYKFTVNEKQEIVYGIGAIKGVGEGPIDAIIEARELDGRFSDLFDFCIRVDLKRMNKRVLEKLVLSGAMDELGPNKNKQDRATLMASIETAMRQAEQQSKSTSMGVDDLFGYEAQQSGNNSNAFNNVQPWPEKQWLDGERDTLGLYLTGHPISQYLAELDNFAPRRITDLVPTSKEVMSMAIGLVLEVRTMINKKGRKWAIVTLDDKSGRLDARVFPDVFEQYQDILQKDSIIVVSGQVSVDDYIGGNTIGAQEIMTLVDARKKYANHLKLAMNSSQQLDKLKTYLLAEKQGTVGAIPVTISYTNSNAKVDIQLGEHWNINPSDELLYELSNWLGKESVQLSYQQTSYAQ